MLEVEDAVAPMDSIKPIEPLPTDTSHIEPALNDPLDPIGPKDIQDTPRDEGGESGSTPMRSVKALLNTPPGKRIHSNNYGELMTNVLGRLRGE
jgi:hypothetical protein